MLIKIFNMQRLLLRNAQIPIGAASKTQFGSQKFSSVDTYFSIILLVLSGLYLFLVDNTIYGTMFFIVILTFIALMIKGFLTYNNDFLSLLPVSKKFKFANFYLSGFLVFIISYISMIVVSVILFGILVLCIYLSLGGNSIHHGSDYSIGIYGSMFFLCVNLVFYFVLLATMFVRKKFLSYGLSISFTFIYLIILKYAKNIIAITSKGKSTNDMFMNFDLLANKQDLILKIGTVSIVIIAFSLIVSYFLFTRKN